MMTCILSIESGDIFHILCYADQIITEPIGFSLCYDIKILSPASTYCSFLTGPDMATRHYHKSMI